MVLKKYQIQGLGDPPPPPSYMYVSLSLKKSFFSHLVYVSFSLYYLTLTYVTLCRHLLSHWCLKSTKSRFRVTHLSRGTCMFLFLWKNHFSSMLYMSHFLCIIWRWHMLLYAGIYWASGAWIAPKQGCWKPTSSPSLGTCMFCFLWKHDFLSM